MSVDENLHFNKVAGQSRARFLGAFYTPSSTAEILAKWAVRTGRERVLEPSAGGGALVDAVLSQAGKITGDSFCKILAFDIDKFAIEKLSSNCNCAVDIVHGDFLQQESGHYKKVDVVVANPPFIRNHNLSKERRLDLRTRFNVPASAGLWASFLIHSLSFLEMGGRLASIVPRSVLFTAHGKKFMSRICENFSEVGLYSLDEKQLWSVRADEAGAVILADGYGGAAAEGYEIGRISSSGDILGEINGDSVIYSKLMAECSRLGDVARVSIGAVTGRNKVFLLSEEERKRSRISFNDLQSVVSRARHVSGIRISRGELKSLAETGEKTWLLRPAKWGAAVERYLSVISDEEKQSVVWFKKRDPWWLVQTDSSYDAVLTYMNDVGPRIALLEEGIVCTNTLHCVNFKPELDAAIQFSASLTLISTFGQLAAEKIGRSYGGGVLKFEINEARLLPVLNGSGKFDERLLLKVDKLLKAGDQAAAQELVDAAVFPSFFGTDWKVAQRELKEELSCLRARRQGVNVDRER